MSRRAHTQLIYVAGLLAIFLQYSSPADAQDTARTGTVVEESGAVVAEANLVLRSIQGTVLHQATTAADGTFTLDGLPAGVYSLEVSAQDFRVSRLSLEVSGVEAPPLRIVLSLAPFQSEVTVTAQRGAVTDVESAPPIVTVRDASDFRRRPLTTIGDALNGGTGIMIQQTTPGQVSPFLRGLTGYHVLNLVDGVRFNNSIFRSGPNQYLAFAEPSQVQRIEAMLGPASSQYGSDALGGAIQLLTPVPQFSTLRPLVKGAANLFGASANASSGTDATVFVSGRRMSWLAGGAWRNTNDLRAGRGRDSHHVLHRLFGLSDGQIRDVTGAGQQDTGFRQTGIHTKAAARLADDQNLTVWYQHGELDGVRAYKDQWGGLGRLRSDVTPQRLHFLYSRYEKLGPGPLDWFSGTFSVNSQSDGSIRQGLRPSDRITRDDGRVDAFGYSAQAGTHVASRQAIVFGGEIYDEHVDAHREEIDPVTGLAVQKRALYPNGSRYRTSGLFIQDVIDISRGSGGALKADLSGRFTRVDVRTFADRNRTAMGESLGVIDSEQSHHDWTFNAGLTWQVTSAFTLNGLVGRGFRAPNLNDLGALGLNDLGFEVPVATTLETGALIGTSDGETALSSGRSVTGLKAERLFNVEVGAALRWSRLHARAHVFNAELKDPIVRRTLLFPIDNVPATVAGLTVNAIPPTQAQREQGVLPLATSLDPRAIKAFVNDGRANYRGIDTALSYRVSTRWSAEANYSFLMGHDLDPKRPVRRLPPQQGMLAVRYQPGGKVPWIELRTQFSGAQTQLSGGDITDERIGAARRRSDITDFFQGGLIRPYLLPGGDGQFGTADDVFAPTGETLAQIRDRVLPIGATINGVTVVDDSTRVPLYVKTPGFVSLDLSTGVVLNPHLSLNVAVANLLDRNYRIHGSGVDAPGVNVYAGVRVSY